LLVRQRPVQLLWRSMALLRDVPELEPGRDLMLAR